MYRPYYVPSFEPNLNLPYEYEVPYQQYKTSPWYIRPTYDINRVPTGSVPSSYTYSESRHRCTSEPYLGLNYAYSPAPDFVTHRHTKTGRE
jgi:hypothetical protein